MATFTSAQRVDRLVWVSAHPDLPSMSRTLFHACTCCINLLHEFKCDHPARHLDLATREVTVLHQGKGVQGYVVSGAPQASPGPPTIYVNKSTHILLVEPAAHGAVHRLVQVGEQL